MLVIPVHRCLVTQLKTHTLPIITNSRHFTLTHNLLAVKKSLTKDVTRATSTPGFGQKAKEATRTTYYTAVVVVGLGMTGLMMYAVFKELLSSFSPQTVYSAAVDKCSAHPRIIDFLGDSVKSYGEESRRGRRQHISHLPYEVEGNKGFRMKFYLKGQRRTATAHLDARQTLSGWEFRYLYLQLDSYPYEVIVVEDNRGTTIDSPSSLPSIGYPATTLPSDGNDLPPLPPLFPSK
ncbi:hypothetical protein Pcinc_017786 [Petrolisthes cinctipes]|uniref:Mitochondrial import inner membrane translocase subunit Tim21 n=1 Tax=Petrolisthes cinctipes TaxID=88211 RepID=A0AAE1FNM0_PETCI|nr:hypothetical protein Pcinc_017786 [Petrolisthes cinctipes]